MSTATATTTVGVIGCGNIVTQYMDTLAKYQRVKVAAVSDLDANKAESVREKWSIDKAVTPQDLLDDPSIDIVLNLTIPRAHDEVSRSALNAGKHVYSEKPITESFETAKSLVELAQAKNLAIGCAPDTVMGSTWQLAREMIDNGELGDIHGATVCMQGPGVEEWHPSPAFYYDHGGGPVLDMGPYFLHALVTLLGPIDSVAGLGLRGQHQRTSPEGSPTAGLLMPVRIDTHSAAILSFASGCIGTMLMSFDVTRTTIPDVEIYGSKGTVHIHTPNNFGVSNEPGVGKVKLFKRVSMKPAEEIEIEREAGPRINGRGIGVADMAQAIQEGRPLDAIRASGALALHALEVMLGVAQSSQSREFIKMTTTATRPDPIATGWSY